MIAELAHHAGTIRFEKLSAAARERLLLCLLANLSVGVAGAKHAVVPEPAMSEGAYRLLSGRRAANARAAAFWNGAAMHARTQDDFHPVGNLHIGTVVIPALMAVADEAEMSGGDFLAALAAGYSVAVGLSRRFSPVTTPRGLRSTCLYAPFGAAVAVGVARSSPAQQLASAIALTTAVNAGTTQTWVDGSDEWQVHTALGAQNALLVNDLAAAGVRGAAHALDGPAGFYRAVVGQEVSFAEIAGDLDPSAAIEENVIKRYPVSGICQAVVLAAERAARQIDSATSVSRLRIEMNPFEMRYPGTLNRGPFHSFSDKLMSAAFCAASVVAHSGFRFEDFHSGAHAVRDSLTALAQVEESSLSLLSARVTIETAGGARIVGEVENSRDEVAIDWTSVDDWAAALWTEAGRTEREYAACRDAVRDLPESRRAKLPV
ncbi:MAG: hypothetical protein BroJett024_16220 [Alphaproteobacteria bacterium]|nr:MAG: hypothetical protein BroJett024_16220 [Alphaproteobacteria bacterium]